MATLDYEDFSIDHVTAITDALAKGGAAFAVHSTYFSGPASRLPSVAAKADAVAKQLSELDFDGIRNGLSVGAKLQGPMAVEKIGGKAVVAIDLINRTGDVIDSDEKVSRTAANLVDFGGAIVATEASAATGATAGSIIGSFFLGPGTVIGGVVGGVVGGLVGALSYTVASIRYDLVDLLQEGIQAVGKGIPAALSGVIKGPSSWEVDQLGNPSYPAGLYDEVSASGETVPQGNGIGPSDPHDPRGQWQTPRALGDRTGREGGGYGDSRDEDRDSGGGYSNTGNNPGNPNAPGYSGNFSGTSPSGGTSREQQGRIDNVLNNGTRTGGLPILPDLDGDGIEITELSKSTVFTDTSGDGLDHRTAWAGTGDGVLFIDADGNGQLSNSHEYVFTEWADGARDDLDALRRAFDSNGDGKLTKADPRWSAIRVIVTHANGMMEAIPSRRLASQGSGSHPM